MNRLVSAGVGLALVFGVMQLAPVDRSNPLIEAEPSAPPEVAAILQRACYDCHSHATRWPWYSRIAPASWLLAHDVREGRDELNFSTWNRRSAEKQREAMNESWEAVKGGHMPPWFYVIAHPEARLSGADREAVRAWAQSAGPPPEEAPDE